MKRLKLIVESALQLVEHHFINKKADSILALFQKYDIHLILYLN